MVLKFPEFRIRLITREYKDSPRIHWIICQNMNNAATPKDYQLFYATKNTRRWVKLPMEERFDALPKNKEEWRGCWLPLILAKDIKEKRRFWTQDPESPIIWRLDYKSRLFWHSSCEMFTWDGEKWKQKDWNDYYTQGFLAHFFFHGNFFIKSKRQIKTWRKENSQ